jgi:hypothetical protein
MICQECALQLYARGPLMSMPHATLKNQPSLSPSQIADLRLAASKLTGPKRRACEAEMTVKYCGGTPQGDRILSCSGYYREQVMLVEAP